jgi:hypothetical protein
LGIAIALNPGRSERMRTANSKMREVGALAESFMAALAIDLDVFEHTSGGRELMHVLVFKIQETM